jgi:uncharacterized membrane protein
MKLRLLILFIIGGIVGFIIDTTYRSVAELTFSHQGFATSLFGFTFPFLPIYGFGLVIIYLIHRFVKNIAYKAIFFGLSLALLEFFGGMFTKLVLGTRLWDYSTNTLNILGHTDALHIIYWVVLGLLADYVFKRIKKLI